MKAYRREYSVGSGWVVVLKKAPIGWFTRLEDGPFYRGPASWVFFSWWWRPTELGAYARAMQEAYRYPRRGRP